MTTVEVVPDSTPVTYPSAAAAAASPAAKKASSCWNLCGKEKSGTATSLTPFKKLGEEIGSICSKINRGLVWEVFKWVLIIAGLGAAAYGIYFGLSIKLPLEHGADIWIIAGVCMGAAAFVALAQKEKATLKSFSHVLRVVGWFFGAIVITGLAYYLCTQVIDPSVKNAWDDIFSKWGFTGKSAADTAFYSIITAVAGIYAFSHMRRGEYGSLAVKSGLIGALVGLGVSGYTYTPLALIGFGLIYMMSNRDADSSKESEDEEKKRIEQQEKENKKLLNNVSTNLENRRKEENKREDNAVELAAAGNAKEGS